jgi:hypothetical protein
MTFAPGQPTAAPTKKSRLGLPMAVSDRLLLFSVFLQTVDIVIMIVAVRRGFFSMGSGPIGHAVGLGPLPVWIILKTSAFMVLILAVLRGRRWLILALDAWFLAFALFGSAMLMLQ